MGGNYVFSNRIFSGSSWPMIIFNIVFDITVISATWATQNSRQH